MPSVTQSAEFFVAGGPVQPERPCYVERAADRLLADAVAAKRLCWVVGPRATGKTSLLLHAAHAARRSGTLVAAIDWRKLVEKTEAAPERGLRVVAERIAAGVKLGDAVVDSWWRARDAHATDNPLVDFLWQVVLTNTTAPIVVLVDDFEAAHASPLERDFLAAIAECYARRGREPDFARLGFVLAGCLTPRLSLGDEHDTTLAAAEIVEPADFSADEAYRLAVAFGGEPELAQALLDRICAWTGGQPYLTQKIARGVARKGGRLEDVERVVTEQLLSPSAAASDPLLRHVRAWLCEPSRPARRALRAVQRVATGSRVVRPADPAVWERLWLSGTVREAEGHRLAPRNRVVKELVAARWLKTPSGWRRAAIAATVLVAILAAGGYWYTQRLPVADIATLTDGGASLAVDEEAYRRLRALPGFAERADRLWLEALGRRGRAAATLADATAVDTRLRGLPGQDVPADRLLGEFWLRRAHEAAHRGQRDAALLLAQRAAALPAAEPRAAAYVAELVGGDYRYLERTLRLATAPGYWYMRFDESALLMLDAEQRAFRAPFGAAGDGSASSAVPAPLTALKPAALLRELVVSGEGTAGELELSLAVQHPEGGELLVTLRAPSGAAAEVRVPRGDGTAVESLLFQAARGSPLAQLADEGLAGSWRLTIVDRAEGNSGFLVGWGLAFGANTAREDFAEGLAIPEPTRDEAVAVRAAGDRALVVPTTPGAIGAVALWNLATGRLEHDFTLPALPRHVALDATGARVLAATGNALSLWNAADGTLVAALDTQTEFVLPPVFSPDGAYFAIAERVDGASPLVSVLRSSDASLVASSDGADGVQEWQLGPRARYFALLGPANVVRVLETRRGTELMRLPHAAPVQRIVHMQSGDTLVTVDAAGAIAAWSLVNGAAPPRHLGRTPWPASVSVAADRVAFARDDGAVAVVATATGAEIARLRQPHAAQTTTQLSVDGTELVTQSGAALRRWRLPDTAPLFAAAATAAAPPVLALDRSTDVVAFGLQSGQLEIGPVAALANPGSSLAFFGHRGPITAAVVDETRGLAATGGADGIVRLWDSATGEPTGIVMQPAAAAIDAVALSADGGAVASAAGRVVRVADVATGRVTDELTVEGAVAVLRFSPGARGIAVADSSGAVTLASGAQRRTAQLGAAATALAFAPDGAQLAVGDVAGALRLVATADAALGAVAREWQGPIRWLEFSPDGRVLFVVTNEWLHAVDATAPTLEPISSRLLPPLPTPRVAVPTSPSVVRFAGFDASGALSATSLDLAAEPDVVPPDGAALVARDWSAALAVELDDNGEPKLIDP